MKNAILVVALSVLDAAFAASPGDTRPIGVFDSGVGGLTVLERLLEHPGLRKERFTYLGDQANMPYGNYDAAGKSAYLRELVIKDALFLLSDGYFADNSEMWPSGRKVSSKIIVIACNTATAYGRDAVESLFQCVGARQKIIGVVNAGVRSALREIDAENAAEPIALGVLATPGTISSGAYPRTVMRECKSRGIKVKIEVYSQGCPGLADAIELGKPDAAKIANDSLRALVSRYRASGIAAPLKAVILGCTHYPFLMPTLEKTRQAMGMDFNFIDPAVDTAEECYQALKVENMLSDGSVGAGQVDLFLSVPSSTLPQSAVAADGTLAPAYKYGRDPGRDEVSTKFVRMQDGKVGGAALSRLVKLLPWTRSAVNRAMSRREAISGSDVATDLFR